MFNLPTVKNDLVNYTDAGFPILYIRTFDEIKAEEYINSVAKDGKVLYEWNGADGFVDFKTKTVIMPDYSLEDTLSRLKKHKELHKKLLIIKDADKYLRTDGAAESEKVIALLKDISRKIRLEANDNAAEKNGIEATVIIISPILHIPKALEKLITVMELEPPDEKEIHNIVGEFIEKNYLTVSSELFDEISGAFKGLAEFEIQNLLNLSLSQEGELSKKALEIILSQKRQIIFKAGILEMIPLKESIDDIGGLEVLKEWLKNKAAVFKDLKKAMEFGVTMPKGVLIAGVPGCGKSLSAKAAGKLFNVPLLRLDMGRLLGKYVGESEENMRRAIQLAETISPCVLWVDELEKAFSGTGSGESSGGVTTRLLGAFLTWMQEKTSAAFVVATANDITKLPPELLRKGRFDEIFYVPLPNADERRKIFEIHLKKHNQKTSYVNIGKLVEKTEGYSGADIEGVVNESVEAAFIKEKSRLTDDEIFNCIKNTSSLSEIMNDPLKKMTEIYENRKFKKASR